MLFPGALAPRSWPCYQHLASASEFVLLPAVCYSVWWDSAPSRTFRYNLCISCSTGSVSMCLSQLMSYSCWDVSPDANLIAELCQEQLYQRSCGWRDRILYFQSVGSLREFLAASSYCWWTIVTGLASIKVPVSLLDCFLAFTALVCPSVTNVPGLLVS